MVTSITNVGQVVSQVEPNELASVRNDGLQESYASAQGMGRNLPCAIGITVGVLSLALFADAFAALVLCLTFWMAFLLLRWPINMLASAGLLPQMKLRSYHNLHLWGMVSLLLLAVTAQQSLSGQLQFWLLLCTVGYHLWATTVANKYFTLGGKVSLAAV